LEIPLPNINSILSKLLHIESTFNERKLPIGLWVQEHKDEIAKNQNLVQNKSDENDVEILLIFLRGILVRAMTGEKGQNVFDELSSTLKNKSDLHESNYKDALKRANYRWGVDSGSQVISAIVQYFRDQLDWNWQSYLEKADKSRETNFPKDELLKIKNVGFKLRDLALSEFNPHYAAFDLHVARIPTRIGLLNYGFDLLSDPNIEMGNNPGNRKNYLFLQRLFIKLSILTNGNFLVGDLDRIFWHFGKSICGTEPQCPDCPIKSDCLAGQYKTRSFLP